MVSVPLNFKGRLPFGTYVTNVCFLGDKAVTPMSPAGPANIAVPVRLKSVGSDDVFLDGFE